MEVKYIFRLKRIINDFLLERSVFSSKKSKKDVLRNIVVILGLSLFSQITWAAWSISVSPTTTIDGNYTVMLGETLGCTSSSGYTTCYSLQESVNSGNFGSVAFGGSSKSFSGKAPGVYSYRVLAHLSGPYPYSAVVVGPVSVEVVGDTSECETVMVDLWGGQIEFGWWQTSLGSCSAYVPLIPYPGPWFSWEFNPATGQYEDCEISVPTYAGQYSYEVCD